MKNEDSYLKSTLSSYPERSGVSLDLVDTVFEKYTRKHNSNLMSMYIFSLFVFFTIGQTLLNFFRSAQIFHLFENKIVIYLTAIKYIMNYLVQFGPIILLLGLTCILVTIYQNKNLLK